MSEVEQKSKAGQHAEPPKESSGFAKSVAMLAGGSVIAQGLAILTAPIVARLYAPEAFGLLAIYSSFVGILAIISCWQYEQAIMIAKDDRQSANVFGLSMLILLVMTALATLVTYFAGEKILELVNASELKPLIWLLPVGMFTMGVAAPLRFWDTRHKRFGRLAKARVAQSASQRTFVIGFGLAGFVSGGQMIVFQLMGWLVTPLYLGAKLISGDLKFILSNLNPASMKEAARAYIKFPLFSSWMVLLNTVSQQIPIILLSAFFGAAIAGYYSNSVLLLQIPMVFVGQAIAQVFFQDAAAKHAEGQSLAPLVDSVYLRLNAIGMLPMMMVAVIGPELFSVFLGGRWYEAGVYSAILAPSLLVNFLFSPMSYLLSVLERQGTTLVIFIATFILRVAALYAGYHFFNDARIAIIFFGVVNFLSYGFLAIFAYYLVKAPMIRPVALCSRYFLYSAPSLAAVAFCKWILELNHYALLATAFVSALPYFYLIIKTDPRLKEIFLKAFGKINGRIR